jgi:hypothetical protein
MSARRPLVAAIAAATLCFVLGGCSLLPLVAIPGATSSAAPTKGQCWTASVAQADDWSAWEGSGATVCSARHTLYTYEVGKISGVSASTWAAPGDPTSLSDEVETKAANACNISTLLPHEKWNQQLIQDFFFVPTEKEWKAGARWVRCDVGVLAIGSTIDDEKFAPLPTKIAALVAGVNTDPERYEFCVNSPQSVTDAGPLDDPQATIADCSKSPQWKLAAHGNLPEAAGAPFPADAIANAESTKICSPAASGDGQVWLAYLPTKADWATGDREVDCWVGQKPLIGGQTA